MAPAMPELVGLSIRQASETLAAAGIACRSDKRGDKVTRQEPGPGMPVTTATPCAVIY